MRRLISAAALACALLVALVAGQVSKANAQLSIGIGDHHNSFSLSIVAPPVYVAPAPPVYVAPPPPVYVAPPPVYVAPRGHYYAPRPRYVAPRHNYYRVPAHPAQRQNPHQHR